MFGVGISMEELPCVLIIGKVLFYLGGYLSSHIHVQFFIFGGGPMKINFQMLAFWLSRSLGF
jgi:hypothetical protein